MDTGATRGASRADARTLHGKVVAMIDRQHDRIIIECDSCDELFEGERGDEWDTVWGAAKREGWTSRKIANEWLHGCPKCGAPT